MLTSYAQNFEDVILWRALQHVESGFYIDIGAHDPVADSVSLAFYEKGWRGVHVEPVPASAAKLRHSRPDEDVIEAAITRAEGHITIFEIGDTGLTTGNAIIAEKHKSQGFEQKEITAAALPLSHLLDRYADREIHWLKIDVEGMELEVVESWRPSPARPWVLCIESTLPNSRELDFAKWHPVISELGYRFVYFDGLNRFYVHQTHDELLAAFGAGPNLFDDFAVGGRSPYARTMISKIETLEKKAEIADVEMRRLHRHIAATGKAHSGETSALTGRLSSLELEASEREAEIGRLRQQMVQKSAEFAAERGALAERAGSLEKLAQEKAAEIDQLRGQLLHDRTAYDTELGRLAEQAVLLETISKERAAEIGRLDRQFLDAKAAYADERAALLEKATQLDKVLNEKYAEVNRLSHLLAQASDHASGLAVYIDALKGSTSWRMTSPLRAVADWVRR